MRSTLRVQLPGTTFRSRGKVLCKHLERQPHPASSSLPQLALCHHHRVPLPSLLMEEYAKEGEVEMREIRWCVMQMIPFCPAPTDNFKQSGVVNHARTQGLQSRPLKPNLEKDNANPSTTLTRTLVTYRYQWELGDVPATRKRTHQR